MDQFALYLLHQLGADVTKYYEQYEFHNGMLVVAVVALHSVSESAIVLHWLIVAHQKPTQACQTLRRSICRASTLKWSRTVCMPMVPTANHADLHKPYCSMYVGCITISQWVSVAGADADCWCVKALEVMTKSLAPFTPHVAEDVFEHMSPTIRKLLAPANCSDDLQSVFQLGWISAVCLYSS
jgi:hypothetical protein